MSEANVCQLIAHRLDGRSQELVDKVNIRKNISRNIQKIKKKLKHSKLLSHAETTPLLIVGVVV